MSEPEVYEVIDGETPLTHRAFRIGGCLVQVFDSSLGAEKYIRKHAKEDYSVLLRGKTYFLRRGAIEATINLKTDGNETPLISAAQTIAGEIETMILRENPKYADAYAAMDRGAA